MSADGLASLRAKREKATSSSSRHLPPARNAPKKPSGAALSGEDARSPQAGPIPPAPPRQPEVNATQPEVDEPPQLVRATIYMLADDDDWLEGVAREARTRRPRVDASRSAVTRLALTRLRESMTPEEIVDLLSNRAASSQQSIGRKRL